MLYKSLLVALLVALASSAVRYKRQFDWRDALANLGDLEGMLFVLLINVNVGDLLNSICRILSSLKWLCSTFVWSLMRE